MTRLLGDAWFQALALTALMSGGLLAWDNIVARRLPEAAADAAGRAAAAPAAGIQKLVQDTLAQAGGAAQEVSSPDAAPAAAAAKLPPMQPPVPPATAPAPAPRLTVTAPAGGQGGGILGAAGLGGGVFGQAVGVSARIPSRHLGRPRKRGEWVIDAAGGSGSDGTSLRDAVFSAVSGDVITVRPGVYKDPIEPIAKDLVIRGAGLAAVQVKILVEDERTAIRHVAGTLTLERLSIEAAPSNISADDPRPFAAVSAEGGALKLKDVDLRMTGAPAAALRVDDKGRVEMHGGSLAGTHADAMVRAGRARFRFVRFAHDISPLIVWKDGRADLSMCDIRLGARGAVAAYDGGKAAWEEDKKRTTSARTDLEKAGDAQAFGLPAAYQLQAGQPAADQQLVNGIQQALQGGGAQPAGPFVPGANRGGRSRFKRDIFAPGRKPGDIR